ncbi:MAG: uracil-DNA glycosylase family protein [Candidatus Saccharibacteria bacterium]
MKTFADKIIDFNLSLDFTGKLPDGIGIMNPFKENDQIIPISSTFYRKYYNDHNQRHLILGINPGRFGAGVTGIPFTDTKRLKEKCDIPYFGKETHEPSSVFVYEVIEAYGGAHAFYNDFYINSICPLGFVIIDNQGKVKNYNYYDSKALTEAVYDFSVENIRKQIALGCKTDVCFCFGTGKNEKFLRSLNQEYGFFKQIIALEHPRFVMQYQSKNKDFYIDKYLKAFKSVEG